MNQNHPEQRENEVFLTNLNKEYFENLLPEEFRYAYERIGYRSKRKGVTAYDVNGNILHGSYPVFVDKDEHDEIMQRVAEFNARFK